MPVFGASKQFASERSTQVDETILRPSQKTFWPVKELDGICHAAQGFAKAAPLVLKWQELLTGAGHGCGPGYLGAGQNKDALWWGRLLGTKDR